MLAPILDGGIEGFRPDPPSTPDPAPARRVLPRREETVLLWEGAALVIEQHGPRGTAHVTLPESDALGLARALVELLTARGVLPEFDAWAGDHRDIVCLSV